MRNASAVTYVILFIGILLYFPAQGQTTVTGRAVPEGTVRDTSGGAKEAGGSDINGSDRTRWRKRSEAIRLKPKDSSGAQRANDFASHHNLADEVPVGAKSAPSASADHTAPSPAAPSGDIKEASASGPTNSGRVGVTATMESPSAGVPEKGLTKHAEAVRTADATRLYLVGIGDALDIRLSKENTDEPLQYTVPAGGVFEHPLLAGVRVNLVGKTTDEIASHIASELERRGLRTGPRVLVNVRDYASHTVIISGLVTEGGVKIIRREAVPLYVIMAEAQPLPKAAQVSVISYITRQTSRVALDDQAAMNMLIRPGDVLTVSGKPQQFYYIGGDVVTPGQKELRPGSTLTQVMLAAGVELHPAKSTALARARSVLTAGVLSPSTKRVVTILRQGSGGRLSRTDYNLTDIISGTAPDPQVQPDDRIEVRR
jgi:protein involved in polysaccharide export with SLBB domain